MPPTPTVYTTPIHWNPLTSLNEDTQQNTDQGISNGASISVRYGYFKDRWGTSALVIEGCRNDMYRIRGTSTTPRQIKDQEAYQSELAGIYHIVFIVEDICSKHNIWDVSITIA